ncbi:uncharacterized protein K452DRAFT_253209 [Aplosporella prunicola CBS 121167]|uniref:Uncharacterized protein n=1 Tax=Aplosporella prunicola CBS 121167 TaxID=1176127 RepID=A0A6A6BD04_9PEZI|nr:uncharacterized protein K452DRAFT_253209 [Aplosporella prunicola CBS 121167]KAF2140381.1 hypothetical protein K452DRAFT_253209 [Aplosporella prunicola CBS 121167]
MSSAVESHQGVYVRDNFSEPMSAQHNFANQYDLENPHESMSLYNRVMHEHTKSQLERFTSSASRRRSNGGSSNFSDSSRGSVSSD